MDTLLDSVVKAKLIIIYTNITATQECPANRANRTVAVSTSSGTKRKMPPLPKRSMIRPTDRDTKIASRDPGKITNPAWLAVKLKR
ncbi:hypothetical protein D3C75_696930 [compost metagenome]